MGLKNPIIETQRLRLRPFRVSDTRDFFHYTGSSNINKYVSEARLSDDHGECVHRIANVYSVCDFENDFYFAIEEKYSLKLIGAIFCTLVHDFETEFFIYDYYQNEGFMHEALAAFIDFMPKGGALLFKVDDRNGPALAVIKDLVEIEDVTAQYEPADPHTLYYKRIL